MEIGAEQNMLFQSAWVTWSDDWKQLQDNSVLKEKVGSEFFFMNKNILEWELQILHVL